MSGWRGSGGRGCRPLLQEIWQESPGSKRVGSWSAVAESSRGFLDGKAKRSGGRQRAQAPKPRLPLMSLGHSLEWQGDTVPTEAPRVRAQEAQGLLEAETGHLKRWAGGRGVKTVLGTGYRALPTPQGRGWEGLGPRERAAGARAQLGERGRSKRRRPGIGKPREVFTR